MTFPFPVFAPMAAAAPPAGPDLTANLISFWELEEASGARADSHGSYDLTDVNTVTQNTGKVGNAAEMVSANGERLTHADNADLGYSGDFSVAAWFYFNSLGNGVFILSKDATTFGNVEWRISIVFDGGGFRFRFEVHTSGAAGIVTIPTNLSNGTWYFVVATYTAGTRGITFSSNAGTRATATGTADPSRKTTADFVLGGRTGVSALNGRIDQTGFWKRALTTDEEAWLYNSGAGRSYAEIAATGA